MLSRSLEHRFVNLRVAGTPESRFGHEAMVAALRYFRDMDVLQILGGGTMVIPIHYCNELEKP
jgi:hypothetical protein